MLSPRGPGGWPVSAMDGTRTRCQRDSGRRGGPGRERRGAVAVLMTMRIKADAAKVEALDKATMLAIVDKAKEHGVISHHFYGTGDEVLVVDEWPDEASFRAFFESAPEIQKVMGEAGVTSEPEITCWRHLDVGDDIG